MQAQAHPSIESTLSPRTRAEALPGAHAYAGYQIIRRNGAVVGFEPNKIAVALMQAD